MTGIKADLAVGISNVNYNMYKATYTAETAGVYLLNVMWAERCVYIIYLISYRVWLIVLFLVVCLATQAGQRVSSQSDGQFGRRCIQGDLFWRRLEVGHHRQGDQELYRHEEIRTR